MEELELTISRTVWLVKPVDLTNCSYHYWLALRHQYPMCVCMYARVSGTYVAFLQCVSKRLKTLMKFHGGNAIVSVCVQRTEQT